VSPTQDNRASPCERRIRAVLFDLGDTLLNFGKIEAGRLFAEGAQSSYEYLKGLGQAVGSFRLYFWRNLVNLRLQRLISALRGRDFNALALLERVGRRRGLRLTSEQWQHLAWRWYEPLSRICRIEPQTRQTLSKLRSAGLKLGIVSNTFVHASSLEKHLGQLGLVEFFSVRVYSYKYTFRKPDDRIFKIAMERIGQPAQNILYVGDRIDKDIRPALRNGMVAVLKEAYTNFGKKLPAGAHRIARISELPALIERLNAEWARGG